MPYLFVLLIAAAAGGGVAVATMRRGEIAAASLETWTKGYEGPDEEEPAEHEVAETGHPRKPLPSAPTWQTRLTGIVGLLIAVLVGAGLIVGACLAIWAALRRAFGA